MALSWGSAAMIDVRGLVESRLFYWPYRQPFLRAPTAEDVYFTTPDGLRLHAWYFPAEGRSPGDPPAPAILHIHGNAGNINSHSEFSSFFIREGYSVLLFDYRGFGRSDLPKRRLCREDLVTDARAALEYLASREDVDPARITLYGVSLGAVIGLAAAAQDPQAAPHPHTTPSSIIAVAGFSSWQGIARDHAGSIACRLIRPGLDATDSIAKLGAQASPPPLLIVHGEADEIVPVAHANTLKTAADQAGLDVRVILDPEADHNSIVFTSRELQRRIVEWLAER